MLKHVKEWDSYAAYVLTVLPCTYSALEADTNLSYVFENRSDCS